MSSFFKRFSLMTSSFLCATLTASAVNFTFNGFTYKLLGRSDSSGYRLVSVVGIDEKGILGFKWEKDVRQLFLNKFFSCNGKKYCVEYVEDTLQKHFNNKYNIELWLYTNSAALGDDD